MRFRNTPNLLFGIRKPRPRHLAKTAEGLNDHMMRDIGLGEFAGRNRDPRYPWI